MKKRLFALTMAAVMTVGLLAGCGGGDTTDPDTKPTVEAGADEGTTGTATATFKLGGIGPLTGGAAI